MIRFLIDTNTLSEPLRPQANEKVLARMQQYQHQIATASIVWHELQYGCRRLPLSRRREQIEMYLKQLVTSQLTILPYDTLAATWHAKERERLARIGKTPAFADTQIAAVAASNNLILVTRNLKDFDSFSGLQVENWFE